MEAATMPEDRGVKQRSRCRLRSACYCLGFVFFAPSSLLPGSLVHRQCFFASERFSVVKERSGRKGTQRASQLRRAESMHEAADVSHARRGIVSWLGGMLAFPCATLPSWAELNRDERMITMLFERVTPGVVSIGREPPSDSMDISRPTAGTSGSGFVWDGQHVVTNFHVIQNLPAAYVTFILRDSEGTTRRTTRLAQIVGSDPASDVAVLRVADVNETTLMKPLRLGKSTGLLVGQDVLAFGNPFGLEHSLSRGIISGVSRKLEGAGGRPISGVIQTDASINPGNSGGPLLNSDGEVIGVNTAILSGSGMFSGVGLAIPIDTVKRNVESILSKGFVKRPLLGIVFAPDVMNRELQLNGIMAMKLVPTGPASASGIRPMRGGRLGDVVTAVDGKKISLTDDLFGILDNKSPGDVVKLTVQRPSADVDSDKYEILDVAVTLGEAES